jgi:LacI family transcriptional regulator
VSESTDEHAAAEAPVGTRKATLAEVAERAGVSLKTASRVFNDEPYVAEATRARVEAAAAALGFRLNQQASMLRKGIVSSELALIVGDMTNPFYAGLAKGMESALRERGLYLTLVSSDESEDVERHLLAEFSRRNVLGVALVSTLADHTHLDDLGRRGIGLVFIDRPPVGLPADSVVLDNFGGGLLATNHLLAQGHRRIDFIGDYSRLPTHLDRSRGFEAAMTGADVRDARSRVHEGAHGACAASALAAQLLTGPDAPTAIIAGNNRVCLGVLQAVSELAPQTAVVGFDRPEFAELLKVTTVWHSPEDMGRVAVELLLSGQAAARGSRQVVLPMTLSEEGSGERPPAQVIASP